MIREGDNFYTATEDGFNREHNEMVVAFRQMLERDKQMHKVQQDNYIKLKQAEKRIEVLESRSVFEPLIHRNKKPIPFKSDDWIRMNTVVNAWVKMDKKDKPTVAEYVNHINKTIKPKQELTVYYFKMMVNDTRNLLHRLCL